MTPAEMGRVLQGLRKQQDSQCAFCGKPFRATTRRQYCSDSCRLHAWHKRQGQWMAVEVT